MDKPYIPSPCREDDLKALPFSWNCRTGSLLLEKNFAENKLMGNLEPQRLRKREITPLFL
jgi:hypothetical protein